MTLYEGQFATEWDTLDLEAATERAYAIGVAEQLGERNREHLERLYEDVDAAYEQTIVELAYEEGRREAADGGETDSPRETWATLVEEQRIDVDAEELPTGGRDVLPDALDSIEAIERVDLESRGAIDRPGFLDR